MAHEIGGDFRHHSILVSAPDVSRGARDPAPMLGL